MAIRFSQLDFNISLTSTISSQIAGFSAWSSAREPSQVFLLLESVYRAFDEYVIEVLAVRLWIHALLANFFTFAQDCQTP